MGIFSDWSLDELRKDFAKRLASDSFKELCEEYFTSLIQEEKLKSNSLQGANATVQFNDVSFSNAKRMGNISYLESSDFSSSNLDVAA